MNVNTRFFSAYNHRHRQPNVGYRSPLNNQQHQFTSILQNIHRNISKSFLPSITMMNDSKPYYQNDFANNHLFLAKQKLARVFLDPSPMNIHTRNELMHLFDGNESNRKINKNKREVKKNSHPKPKIKPEQDVHLSIINLRMKPTVPSTHTHDPPPHPGGQTLKTLRPSTQWVNPAMQQNIQHNFEPNTVINEFIDNNPDVINNITNPLNSSLLYVKSIIPSAGTQKR